MCEIVRKRHLAQAVIVNFACLLANVSMASAAGPTLQETLDFIQRKLDRECLHIFGKTTTGDYMAYKREKDRKLTLLNQYTIVLEKNCRYLARYMGSPRGPRFDDSGMREWDGHLLSIKFRLSDLTTNVRMKPASSRPSTQAVNISINCGEGDCIEVRETSIGRPSRTAQKNSFRLQICFLFAPRMIKKGSRKL